MSSSNANTATNTPTNPPTSNTVNDKILALVAPIVADLKLDLYDLEFNGGILKITCLLYTSPSPRDRQKSRMPSSA